MNQRIVTVHAIGGPLDDARMICEVDLDDTQYSYTQDGFRQVHLYRRSGMTFSLGGVDLQWTYEGAVSPESVSKDPLA